MTLSGQDVTAVMRQLAQWARRPSGLVDQTRWLFCGCALLALTLTTAGQLLSGSSGPAAVLVLVVAAMLATSWVWRYRTGRAPVVLDVLDILATGAFAAACPDPAMAFGFAFSASWLRVLFGSDVQVIGYGSGLAAGLAASTVSWHLVPGHVGSLDAAGLLGSLPVLLLTIGVARHLASVLFTREQSQHRDAALVLLGTRLIGITDRAEVLRLGWAAIEQICRWTPGLRVIAVREGTTAVQVTAVAGDLLRRPTTLPLGSMPAAAPVGEAHVITDDVAWGRSTGIYGQWIAIGMPGRAGDVVVLGSPTTVSPDGVMAVQSLMNQVALALAAGDAHEDLMTQARTDTLTGLANRAAFSSALTARTADRGRAQTLLLLDLDDFKTVNDQFGHATGDELLRDVADRLRAVTRPSDVCARLGGDEFAVLLTDVSDEFAGTVAQRLVDHIAALASASGSSVRVGVSIGVAHSAPGLTGQELVQHADLAMYEAKRAGKNQVRISGRRPELAHTHARATSSSTRGPGREPLTLDS